MWPSWQIAAAEKYVQPVCITLLAASAFGAKTQVRLEPGGGGEEKAGRAVIIFILAPGHIKLILKKKKKKEVIVKYLVREPAVQMQGAVPAAGIWRDLAQALVRGCYFVGPAFGLKSTKKEHIGLCLMALPWLPCDCSAWGA